MYICTSTVRNHAENVEDNNYSFVVYIIKNSYGEGMEFNVNA